MKIGFAERAVKPEWMDQQAHDSQELLEALRHLRRLNRIFGASRPVLYGVKRLWLAEGKPKRLTVLDAGCGSGDINKSLLSWAARMNVNIRLILADVTEEAQTEAERLYSGDHRVTFVRRSLFDLPAGYADFVTASQFAHHFAQEELPDVVRRMLEVSKRGIVLSDLHRHWLPWAAVWTVTRLVSRNRYIRHDGPLSVAKGFRRADWEWLAAALGRKQLDVRWRPLFRWVLTLQKPKQRETHMGGQTHDLSR